MEGWIKLHRQTLDSPIFSNARMLKIWIWCLLRANHKPAEVVIGLQVIQLQPGQFVMGNKKAGESLGMSKSAFHRNIRGMEKLGNVQLKAGNKYTVVTVANWDKYQNEETEVGHKWETNGKQMGTDKNVKNVKNKEPIHTSPKEETDITLVKYYQTIEELFEKFWKAYPVKKSKQHARKMWHRLFKAEAPKEERENRLRNIDKHLAVYLEEVKGTEKKFIKHAGTWLNSEDFNIPPEEGEE